MDIAGNVAPPLESPGAHLVRDDAPGARRYFESTEVVGPNVWQPLEAQRALRSLLLDFVDRVGTCRAAEAESIAATRRVERRSRPSWADGV